MDESLIDPGTRLLVSRRVVLAIVLASAAPAPASTNAADYDMRGHWVARNPEVVFAHEALRVTPIWGLSTRHHDEQPPGRSRSIIPGLRMEQVQAGSTIAGRQQAVSPRISNVQQQAPPQSLGPAAATTWPDHSASTDFNATEILGRIVRGTLTVLVLLGLSLWGLRQWMKRSQNASPPTGSLSVVDSTVLSGRCRLQLVEADGHRVLVGIDAGGVKCITVLPDRFVDALSVAEAADDDALVSLNASRFERRPNQTTLAVGQPA